MGVPVALPGVVAASRRRTVAAAGYSAEVLADNPLLYLRCEETAGATVANTGSLGSSATANGSYTRNITNAGGAGLGVGVSFPGSIGTYIEYPHNAALDITGNVTYEMWVQCDDFSALHYLMSKGKDSGGNPGYSLYLFTDRSVQIWRSATAVLFNGGIIYPNDTSWHHLAFTNTSSVYRIYIDGALVATSGTVGSGPNTTGVAFGIGRELTGGTPNGQHKGDVDEIAVYNTALSSTRIAAHYAARNTP